MEKKLDTLKDEVADLAIDLKKVPHHPSLIFKILKKFWRTFKKPLLILTIIGFGILLMIPPITYLYFVRDLSTKESIINHKNAGVILTDRNDQPFFNLYEGRTKKAVPLSQIPKHFQEAIISVEDRKFYEHPGFSLQSIGRALVSDVKTEQLSQGGSTITQQLVKNTLLTQQKSFLRKYQELFLAMELERRFTKDDILEMYANTVYFGEGAYGVHDAAQAYFGTDITKLSIAQSALLAAILPAPSAYSPISGNRAKAFQRQRLVLQLMQTQGYITKDEQEKAVAADITFNESTDESNDSAPHFALMVKEDLIKRYGEQTVANSGFRVRTTIDLPFQEFAEKVVKQQVTNLRFNKVTNAATVAVDPKTGEILALVGSHDWYDETNGKINMALRARQPGSSFKPIVYTRAIQRDLITAATVLEDKAITYPDGYKPLNYDKRFRDSVLVRRALATSLNIPAVHVMERVGVDDTLEFAKELGITTLTGDIADYGLSLVLGAGEVPLLQMVEAYSIFAAEGVRITPTTIMQITDKRNNVIYTSDPDKRTILSKEVAFIISSILSDNAARAEVFGTALNLSRPAAVKTGTTNDYKDALTIGYTPQLTVGVWVGNNDNTPMDSIAGSLGAAPIWRQMMEFFLRGRPIERFNVPSTVLRVTICKENGLRAQGATSSAMTEYFLSGTLPTKSCTDDPSATTTQAFPTSEQSQFINDPTATPLPQGEPTSTSTPTPSFPIEELTPTLPPVTITP